MTLSDDKASVSCTPAIPTSLAPAGTIGCTASYTITQAELDAGSLTNVATVTGTAPDGTTVTDTDDETVTADQTPAIDIVKSSALFNDADGSTTVSAGDTIQLHLR